MRFLYRVKVALSRKAMLNELVKAIFGSASLRVSNIVLGMMVSIFLARELGVQDFGLYSFILSLITLLGLPLRGGLPTLITREVARFHSTEQWNYIKGIMRAASVFIIILSSIIGFGIFLANLYGHLGEQEHSYTDLLIITLIIPSISLVFLKASILRGLRKVVQGNLSEQLVIPASLFILVNLVHFSGNKLTAMNSLTLYFSATLIGLFVSSVLVSKNCSHDFKDIQATTNIRTWVKSLVPLTIFSSLSIASGQVSLFLLGVLDEESSVALFRVSMQISILVGLGLTIVNTVIAPHIVRLSETKENDKLQKLLFFASLFSTLFALPLLIIFMFFGKSIIALLFGEDFSQAYVTLIILSFGQFINAISGSVALVLNMKGFEFETVKGVGIALIINITITVILIPTYGAVGAAIGVTIAQAVWNILLIIRTYSLTGFNPTAINFNYTK